MICFLSFQMLLFIFYCHFQLHFFENFIYAYDIWSFLPLTYFYAISKFPQEAPIISRIQINVLPFKYLFFIRLSLISVIHEGVSSSSGTCVIYQWPPPQKGELEEEQERLSAPWIYQLLRSSAKGGASGGLPPSMHPCWNFFLGSNHSSCE